MFKDTYFLAESDPFVIIPSQEIRVDIKLNTPPRNYGFVEGWVRPLVHACIKAFDLYYNPVDHTYTDQFGNYQLKLLPGYYLLGAVAPGFELSSLVRIRALSNTLQSVNFWLSRNSLYDDFPNS